MVRLSGVGKTFGGTVAVDAVSLDLAAGRFLTILGPSGCGKTTLLRMIAGFIAPTTGRIEVNGAAVESVPPWRRSIGMVFQRLALFPHLSAFDNVAYPLRMRRFPAAGIAERVERYLELVRLPGMGGRRPHELSGGQQQRVAIARALVFEPDILLLDEPLAALDRKLREDMQLEFRRIQQELGVTTINVTHDQREALVMSDEVMVMHQGRVQQSAPPAETYGNPANRFVAGFLGLTNFLDAEVLRAEGERRVVRIGGAELSGTGNVATGARVTAALRAEKLRLLAPGAVAETQFPATVTEVVFEGDRILYEVRVDGLGNARLQLFDHDPEGHGRHSPGDIVTIGWSSAHLLLFTD
ncbi:MAG: ABC transporter ATP-binding protein [Geminicoccaceae bacterium]|nr:ABC transporter ATP-binding protein [Geminicoccaceae bacterium]